MHLDARGSPPTHTSTIGGAGDKATAGRTVFAFWSIYDTSQVTTPTAERTIVGDGRYVLLTTEPSTTSAHCDHFYLGSRTTAQHSRFKSTLTHLVGETRVIDLIDTVSPLSTSTNKPLQDLQQSAVESRPSTSRSSHAIIAHPILVLH